MWTVVTVILLALCGSCLLVGLTRCVDRDRLLSGIVLSSFVVRACLVLALFYISFKEWPVFPSLQTGGGFWAFGLDSYTYHNFATKIVYAWKHGLDLPHPGLSFEYFAIVAGIYKFLGASPLYPALLNAWLGAITALLAYGIGRRLFNRRAALMSAVLVGFWPSSLLWSSQLLKDSLAWCMTFAAVLLVMALVPKETDRGASRMSRIAKHGLLVVLLALTVIGLTRLRFYMGYVVSLAALISFLPASGYALMRRQRRRAMSYVGISLIVLISTMTAQRINVYQLVSPANPGAGHFRLALQHWERGELHGAANGFGTAGALDEQHKEAYLGLGLVEIQQGNLTRARGAFGAYLELEENSKMRSTVTTVLKRLERREQDSSAKTQSIVQREKKEQDSLAEARSIIQEDESEVLVRAVVASSHWRTGAGVTISERVRVALKDIMVGLPQIGEQARTAARLITPESLGSLREGFVSSGGHSLMDANVEISDPHALIAYLPRALAIGFFAPFPWQWFDTGGSTGYMRLFAAFEMILIYLLIPGMMYGTWNILRNRRTDGVFLLAVVILTAVPVSLVIANLGTLFRLRLQFLLLLLVVAAGGGLFDLYRGLSWRPSAPRATDPATMSSTAAP